MFSAAPKNIADLRGRVYLTLESTGPHVIRPDTLRNPKVAQSPGLLDTEIRQSIVIVGK